MIRIATTCSIDLADTETIRAVVLRVNSPGGTTAGSEALYAVAAPDRREEAGGRRARRTGGLRRLCRGARRRPHRRARQHPYRLDRRHHGISRPHRGDGAAGHRARDRAVVGAEGRAVAVPPDEPGGAGARRGAGRRKLRLVPRAGVRAPGARRRQAGRGRERRGLHRAARARQRPDRRNRRRARGDRLARIARCGRSPTCRSGIGRSSGTSRLRRASWAKSRQPAGFSGKYRFGLPPSSIPSAPDSCQYGGCVGS